MPKTEKDKAREVMRLSNKIQPLLKGRSPEVQGGVLCDLLAIWLAGHAPGLREEVLRIHMEQLRPLIHANEMLMFGPLGHPDRIKGGPR